MELEIQNGLQYHFERRDQSLIHVNVFRFDCFSDYRQNMQILSCNKAFQLSIWGSYLHFLLQLTQHKELQARADEIHTGKIVVMVHCASCATECHTGLFFTSTASLFKETAKFELINSIFVTCLSTLATFSCEKHKTKDDMTHQNSKRIALTKCVYIISIY